MRSYIPYLILPVLCAAALAARAQTSEADLIAKLKSDASHNDKVIAAHTLGQVGTKAAIAPLAELLGDAKMAHAARYALAMIPDPAVDAAFRDAAGKLQGLLLAGVFQSMGDRRDAAAVPLLAKRLGDADAVLADAAAGALGRIGNADAAKALKPFLGKSAEASRGYLRCAAANPALYADILKAGDAIPKGIRFAALRGDLLAKGLKLADFQSKNPDDVDIALGVALELPKSDALQKVLIDAFQNVPPIREQLCVVFAQRGEPVPFPYFRKQLTEGNPAEQIAVARMTVRLGMSEAIPDIVDLSMSNTPAVASEMQALLGCFPEGPQRTAALNALLGAADAKRQIAGINVATQMRDKGAIPTLLKLSASADNAVSDAAFKALGAITDITHFDALINAFLAKPASDAALRAIMALCSRQASVDTGIEIRKALYGNLGNADQTRDITDRVKARVKNGVTSFPASNELAGGDPANGIVKYFQMTYAVEGVEKQVKLRENETVTFEEAGIPAAVRGPLNAAYAKAKGDAKSALLRVYSAFEGQQSLDVITAAANQDADAALKEAATRLLFESKSLSSLPALEGILKDAKSADRMKTLALRAYLRLLNDSEMAPGMRIAYLTKLNATLARDVDRKTVKDAIAEEMKAGQDETGFTPMFNGKDLAGWDSRAGWWFAKDGLLIGESTPDKPCKQNDHLIWTGGKPGDFEIRTEFRLSKSANSGIQLRSENVSDRDTGYQADSEGNGAYVGFLYHPAFHLVGGRGECTTLASDKTKNAWR
ncbi:MAG: DUF1080 domain-containing protein, partial [Kiritimatiellaeota bacterium]|nr:DUF1080 domain-containing protein [Kiritimatiellota bacterium]